MEPSVERPQTPPLSYLMTPPSTGGMAKRVRFSNVEYLDANSNKTGREINFNEGESPDVFFHEPEETFDSEIREKSDDEGSTSTASNLDLPSPVPADSYTAKPTALEKHDPFASLALAIDSPIANKEPFPFMNLPISVRDIIYSHLLVVPGLICVRQKHTVFHDEKKAFLHAERREFLPGIAYALVHLHVDGHKTRFSLVGRTNINILRANKEIFAEAKAVLYGKNMFEIVRSTNELCPPPDYSVRLFPTGCQRLITKLNIKIRSFYDLHWLLSGGYNVMKNYYRGLVSLTLVLEMDSTSKGFGKTWTRNGAEEKWADYVQRLRGEMAKELFKKMKVKGADAKIVPVWMNLRVLFSGEAYDGSLAAVGDTGDEQRAKQDETKQGLVEAWELFKKGRK
ncbi:hypothetical protein J4E85_006923 [Alternaria conjuncta]|uniref:uncharacterized protein n=1 Tax=Alternaria conjuncta TaxID=181017 RepID=UPI00221F0746|nr:uncharacterized protein J4E85_006923 [Alternaria conjuncta]KAI4926629.1 hypothetical protein J4E85_006923 [Alternaria conjuncta]